MPKLKNWNIAITYCDEHTEIIKIPKSKNMVLQAAIDKAKRLCLDSKEKNAHTRIIVATEIIKE